LQLKKLVIINILISIGALILVGALVFSKINTTIKDQFIYSNRLVLENGNDLIESFIKKNKDTVLDIAINPTIQNELDMFQKENANIGNINSYIENHWFYDNRIKSVGGFIEAYPYKDNEIFSFDENMDKYTEIQKHEWMSEVIEKNGAFAINTCEIEGISYIRIAMLASSIENWPDKFCIFALYVKTEVLYSIFHNSHLENSSSPYLVDEYGKIILPYEDSYKLSDNDLMNMEQSWWKKGNHIILNAPMTSLNWKLMGILPENELMIKSEEIKETFFLVGGVVVIVLLFISYIYSAWITRPITALSSEMARVEQNDFREIEISESFGQETKDLYNQFNYMVRRINSLIDEVYMAQISEKEAELLALQKQINPHFLYNTLDSIAWMSMKYKAEDIRYMVMSLASMMRYSLNNGNNYISVRDELEQVRNYVGIQEIRFNNKFTTTIDADNDVLDYEIIKLIIQPLVENAIIHGFKLAGGFGEIIISAKRVLEHLEIKVINDGIEIDLDKVKKILHEESKEKQKHYGLRNINDRLIMSFGRGSAIAFSVRDGKTIASIRIRMDLLKKGELDGQT
jgi:two-component system sensor histidine kinase YesM